MIPDAIAKQLADALHRALTAQCRIHGSAGREYWKDEFSALDAYEIAAKEPVKVKLRRFSIDLAYGEDAEDCFTVDKDGEIMDADEVIAALKEQGIEVEP